MTQTSRFVKRAGAALYSGFALVLLIASCSSGPEFVGSVEGTEQAPCRASMECDAGLVCLSNVCVDGGSGGSGGATEGGTSSAAGTQSGGAKGGNSQGAAGDVGLAGAPGGGGAAAGAGSQQDGGGAGTPTIDCTPSTPQVLVDPPRRRCDAGECYCSFDSCYPADTAAACCEQPPLCADGSERAEVNCSGKHPIIGPPRTCEPGFCLCSKDQLIDVCLPQATAASCCPPGVALKCVAE